MTLKLYFHPLASYCWKVLIALYENDTAFEPHLVDLGNEASRAELLALSRLGKMAVLRDEARNETVPESSIIIEYLALHYPGGSELLPRDPNLARRTRYHDRFFDLYVHDPMQRIVGDRLRPKDKKDPYGIERARAQLALSYDIIATEMAARPWAAGDTFTMADCAAAPALFYANEVQPFGKPHRVVSQYLERLMQRPSFARVIDEARPYFHMFPKQ